MKSEKYIVLRIDEPDFGCEGVPDGYSPSDTVLLESESGEHLTVRQDDAMLYSRKIDEGSEVCFDNDKNLMLYSE